MRILVFSPDPSSSQLLQTLREQFSEPELMIVHDLGELQNALAQNKIDLAFLDTIPEFEWAYPQIEASIAPDIPVLAPLTQQPVSEILGVLDSTNDWIEWHDADGKIYFISSAVEKITGYPAEKFRDDPEMFKSIVHPDDLAIIQKHHADVQSRCSESRAFDYRIIDRTGDVRWIHHECNPIIRTGQWSGHFAHNRDITRFKHAEDELNRSYQTIQHELEQKIEQRTDALNQANLKLQQRFNEIQQAAAETEALASVSSKVNMLVDLPDILQTVTEEAAKALKYDYCSISLYNEELDAFLLAAISPPVKLPYPFPAIPRQTFEKVARNFGSPIIITNTDLIADMPGFELMQLFNIGSGVTVPMIQDEEILGMLNVGSTSRGITPSDSDLKLLHTLANQTLIGIEKTRLFEEVTESRERLRALSNRLVEIQEQERRALAVELHDEVGQSLTLLRLNLDIIARLFPVDAQRDAELQSYLSSANETVVGLLEKVREISLNLRPTMLDDLGLIPALSSLSERFTSQTNIQVLLKHSGLERRYHPNLEITIFRIIQEALTNSARHADADQVSVRIWTDRNFLRLQVQDEGVGFDVDQALQQQKTSGLSGMIERAVACGGSLEIDSTAFGGTCITGEFPLYIYGEAET